MTWSRLAAARSALVTQQYTYNLHKTIYMQGVCMLRIMRKTTSVVYTKTRGQNITTLQAHAFCLSVIYNFFEFVYETVFPRISCYEAGSKQRAA